MYVCIYYIYIVTNKVILINHFIYDNIYIISKNDRSLMYLQICIIKHQDPLQLEIFFLLFNSYRSKFNL